jgi:hypothetical protein
VTGGTGGSHFGEIQWYICAAIIAIFVFPKYLILFPRNVELSLMDIWQRPFDY